MAKSKHSTALFEVIKSHKGLNSRGDSLLRTPRWWFPGHARTAVSPAATAVHVAPLQIAPPVAQPAPAPPAPARSWPADQGRSGVHWAFDRDRQELTLRLRYTTACVSGFAILVALGLAYVMGRHLGAPQGTAAASPSTDELRDGIAEPRVLEVGPGLSRPAAATVLGASRTQRAEDPSAHPREVTPKAALAPDGPADGRRTVGLNYIIVQSYPNEKSATDACELLSQNGIPCTVEKGPKQWADPSWFSVVTVKGFPPHSGEYEPYARAIRKAGEKMTAGGRSKRFDPQMYRWRE